LRPIEACFYCSVGGLLSFTGIRDTPLARAVCRHRNRAL
jgi:hypothetical protein